MLQKCFWPPDFRNQFPNELTCLLEFWLLEIFWKKIRSTCWKHQVRWQEFLSANRTELTPKALKSGPKGLRMPHQSQRANKDLCLYIFGLFFRRFWWIMLWGYKTTAFKELMNFNNPSKKTMYISKDGHLSLYKDKKKQTEKLNVDSVVFQHRNLCFSFGVSNFFAPKKPCPQRTPSTTVNARHHPPAAWM